MARSPVRASWPYATCSNPSGTISSSGRDTPPPYRPLGQAGSERMELGWALGVVAGARACSSGTSPEAGEAEPDHHVQLDGYAPQANSQPRNRASGEATRVSDVRECAPMA